MTNRTYRLPDAKHEQKWSLLLGSGFAFILFVLMALAQMLGDIEPPKQTIDETLQAFAAPIIEEIEEEPPPPPEEEEPPPELESEPPQLSLDQLDIALNPGTGGSLAGDFAMPTIGSSASELGTEDFVDFSDLDQVPRPAPGTSLNFPRRLKKKAVSGKVVLFIQLDEDGRVLEAKVDSSTLPKFDSIVLGQVKKWKFSPPTKNGQPVRAQARLPIPINIRG